MAAPRERRVERERDFYRGLLELSAQERIVPLLDEALALITEVTGAEQAYLELHASEDASAPDSAAAGSGAGGVWWRGHRCSDEGVADIRRAISSGIVAHTIASGRTIVTPSALDDASFSGLGSVRRNQIRAVLCAPVGTPPIGVVYLQGRSAPGLFTAEDCADVELFARQLASLADRLLARETGADAKDYTGEVRKRFGCAGLIGRSRSLASVLEQAALVAPLDIDLLITGLSGTGKTLLARAIAQNSARADGPFLELNCAALPETLLENELFGAAAGGHSAAIKPVIGKVAAAHGGTLFLDEIAEMSLSAQAKLLQLLQSRTYYPLGASEPLQADVRIISATNADLETLVAERRFREDLYYRLRVLPLRMPALSERRADIPLLVEHAVLAACQRHGFPPMTLTRRALSACRESPWPGNVRELVHAAEAAAIRAHGERRTEVDAAHIFPRGERGEADTDLSFQEATRRFQRDFLRDALERSGWNVTETARRLDIARSHVYNLIRVYGLERTHE
ncbi:sigma 54-interacting transcriptional regulator [Haliangium sp.]|uniref:sigma 54-interacting transcriptional regulator n=1 Tax=Haliangium sp. TaxID=2663208 RepID=UPI003D0A9A26